MTNVNVLPVTLGKDSLTNLIHFWNGTSALTNYPYSDPLLYVGWNCGCGYSADATNSACDFSNYLACATTTTPAINSAGTNLNTIYAQINNLAPAESRTLTLEYYVSDHRTVPPATYSVYSADRVNLILPPTLEALSITTNRFVNGTFIIEFPTQLGRYYYVQYDSTSSFTNPLTSFPAVTGTGSRVQWIDDGPPKTISPPVNGSRFYRVLQTP